MVPIVITLSWVFGGGAIEFAGASLALITAGGVGLHLYKEKQRNKNQSRIGDYSISCSGEPEDPDKFKKKYPHGRYEDASYHHRNSKGRKGPAPKDGQAALDNSFQIQDTSPRRIAVSGNEIVILDQTSPGCYHGHVREWHGLKQNMKNILVKNKLVKPSGKIIT